MCRFKKIYILQNSSLNSFNTSYVSVQVNDERVFYSVELFQYILCVGSSTMLFKVFDGTI